MLIETSRRRVVDFTKNKVLKENYTFLVADESGQVQGSEYGFYDRDTRFLNQYAWNFGSGVSTLVSHSPRPDKLRAYHARLEGPSQRFGIHRSVTLTSRKLLDTLRLENTSLETLPLTLELSFAADFADLFEARGWHTVQREAIQHGLAPGCVRFYYTAPDGVALATQLAFQPAPQTLTTNTAQWTFTLAPGEAVGLEVHTTLETPLDTSTAAIPYDAWKERFRDALSKAPQPKVLEQAVHDLRALLLFTEHGPVPAAGIPWYVAVFGRDSLLTAMMLLPYAPDVAAGTLRFLAAYQGKKHDAFHAENPGKIIHELRYGELSRLEKVPFGPYYGTVDATALWVMLLHDYWQQTNDTSLLKELRGSLEASLTWLSTDADPDGDGFTEFSTGTPGNSNGLVIHAWKDSVDSMSHTDGSLPSGLIAVCEAQGYTYAAYKAAATLLGSLGDADAEAIWKHRAATLKEKFQAAFWLDDLQTYALALDHDKKPLRVYNSNAGHLLWTGIVPEVFAGELVKSLFAEHSWSGWGIRTLGENEVRYNPVSYHNGSVWPHDTALAAKGMVRYGFKEEATRIHHALYDLAASQLDLRLPELVGGFERTDIPPVPYPEACRPQAWDAAALLYVLEFVVP
jgi:glycogen debranching enzyme